MSTRVRLSLSPVVYNVMRRCLLLALHTSCLCRCQYCRRRSGSRRFTRRTMSVLWGAHSICRTLCRRGQNQTKLAYHPRRQCLYYRLGLCARGSGHRPYSVLQIELVLSSPTVAVTVTSRLLIIPTHGGTARLSWPAFLGQVYPRTVIQLCTNPASRRLTSLMRPRLNRSTVQRSVNHTHAPVSG